MSYSALAHRAPVFLALLGACVALRLWDTPVTTQTWARLAVDWLLVGAFLAVVLPLRRLGRARTGFFRVAREQRDELVREVEMAARVQQHLLDQHQPPSGPLDVVARIPVSRSVLQRRFRKELGRSIQEEIVHTRLKRARQLLAETDLPLIEVAERSGFKHQEYLGAIFKAKTGTTPAQYRREACLNLGTRPGLPRRTPSHGPGSGSGTGTALPAR